jgi:hypothetical protein
MGCPPSPAGNSPHHTSLFSNAETPNGGAGFVGLLGRSVSLVSPDEGLLCGVAAETTFLALSGSVIDGLEAVFAS